MLDTHKNKPSSVALEGFGQGFYHKHFIEQN